MENATKALLIAAAVNLSQQQVQAANEKFARYNGTNKRGSEVNAMLNTVLNANVDAAAAGETGRQVAVSGAVTLAGNATSITSQADTSALYTIQVNYDGPGGLVKTIKVTKTSN